MTPDVNAVYARLMQALNVSNQGDLADKLGKSIFTIRQNKTEGRIPEEYLYRVAYETDYRVEWPRSGQGEKLRERAIRRASPSDVRAALDDLLALLPDFVLERILWQVQATYEAGKRGDAAFPDYVREARGE